MILETITLNSKFISIETGENIRLIKCKAMRIKTSYKDIYLQNLSMRRTTAYGENELWFSTKVDNSTRSRYPNKSQLHKHMAYVILLHISFPSNFTWNEDLRLTYIKKSSPSFMKIFRENYRP